MFATNSIVGTNKLTDVFGYWPKFHDAEVVWLQLDRRRQDGGYPPTLEVLIHTFEMTSEVDPNGYCVLRNHVLVRVRFRDVTELRLDGFNHQNVLNVAKFTEMQELQIERVMWDVEFETSYGLSASFRCHNIEVVNVVPCNKDGEPEQI